MVDIKRIRVIITNDFYGGKKMLHFILITPVCLAEQQKQIIAISSKPPLKYLDETDGSFTFEGQLQLTNVQKCAGVKI